MSSIPAADSGVVEPSKKRKGPEEAQQQDESLVGRLRASWKSGEQFVLKRSDTASPKNLTGLSYEYLRLLSRLRIMKKRTIAMKEDLASASEPLDRYLMDLLPALGHILDHGHRFFSWNEADSVTPPSLDIMKRLTPDQPKSSREDLLKELQARALLDATRPFVSMRSRYMACVRELRSIIKFLERIPELWADTDDARVEASFSCLTELEQGIGMVKSLKKHEDGLRRLFRLLGERLEDLFNHARKEIIEGLRHPANLAKEKIQGIHEMTPAQLAATAQRLLDEAMSSSDMTMLDEDQYTEHMQTYRLVLTYGVVKEAFELGLNALNFMDVSKKSFKQMGLLG
ncbi:hypothetical protein KC331_g858 [Hortaea werneckii]|nr:hypothetical protein KC331_g858 [Hortaea werneckii]KAI7722457.1 hypothetical protein KC353_g476 [Hortaea werneckii]